MLWNLNYNEHAHEYDFLENIQYSNNCVKLSPRRFGCAWIHYSNSYTFLNTLETLHFNVHFNAEQKFAKP